jgi:hypothetical protein
MPASDDEKRKMDEAAVQARKELVAKLSTWTAGDVASWWSNWYKQAGHKRLGRILVDIAKPPK